MFLDCVAMGKTWGLPNPRVKDTHRTDALVPRLGLEHCQVKFSWSLA